MMRLVYVFGILENANKAIFPKMLRLGVAHYDGMLHPVVRLSPGTGGGQIANFLLLENTQKY